MRFLPRVTSFAAVSVVLLAGCTEDLTPVIASWESLRESWNKAVASARSAHDDLAQKVSGVVLAEADAAGKELKKRAEDALDAHKKATSELEQIARETRDLVDKATLEEKIASVQAAIDAGKDKWQETSKKMSELSSGAASAWEGLKKHVDAEAAKTAAADKEKADKEAALQKIVDEGGEKAFAITFGKKNVVDDKASSDELAQLVKFLTTCAGLKADLVVQAKDPKAATAQAKALKAWLDGNGGKGRIAKAVGKRGQAGVSVKVVKTCKR